MTVVAEQLHEKNQLIEAAKAEAQEFDFKMEKAAKKNRRMKIRSIASKIPKKHVFEDTKKSAWSLLISIWWAMTNSFIKTFKVIQMMKQSKILDAFKSHPML